MRVGEFAKSQKSGKKSDWNCGWVDTEIIDVKPPNHEHAVSAP